ncbi:hypothetical protein TWF506_004037 [Arthrobotrys conoides]|uniref:Uncharacterized protein n=1 Tax=Arthrobotrys conoides TaxID=74498 RepID=A0AAN8N348_9PEZI
MRKFVVSMTIALALVTAAFSIVTKILSDEFEVEISFAKNSDQSKKIRRSSSICTAIAAFLTAVVGIGSWVFDSKVHSFEGQIADTLIDEKKWEQEKERDTEEIRSLLLLIKQDVENLDNTFLSATRRAEDHNQAILSLERNFQNNCNRLSSESILSLTSTLKA